jgi:hypothetical protein
MRVAGLPLETPDARDGRHRRRREHADRGDQKPRRVAPPICQHDLPAARIVVVTRGGDAAAELDVAAQIELVGDMIEVALGLRLSGKALLPMPFVEQFLRKRIAVGIALGIETRAGITVPVPGAANANAGEE